MKVKAAEGSLKKKYSSYRCGNEALKAGKNTLH